MGAGVTVKQGATAPPLMWELRHRPCRGERRGQVVDLASARTVTATFRHESTKQILCADVPLHMVVPKQTGRVWTPLATEISAFAGLVADEITVTWVDDTVQIFPHEPADPYHYIMVRRSLNPADAPVIPDVSPVVVIADNATGSVTYSGQPVLAGGGSTVSVGAGVHYFTVQANQNGTGWAVGGTPTISTATGTLSAGALAALANSAGDEVTFVLDPDSGEWLASTPAVGSGGAASDASRTMQVPVAAATWTFTHGFGYRPASVFIEDLAGTDIEPQDISHSADNNTTTVTFAEPQAGQITVG